MAREIFSSHEKQKLSSFPKEIEEEDLIRYFTLSESDLEFLDGKNKPATKIGLAVLISSLRFMGFIPEDHKSVPRNALYFLANQLKIKRPVALLKSYAPREQTKSDHLKEVCILLGFKKHDANVLIETKKWIIQRALEHSRPSLLFNIACDFLYSKKVVRPGIRTLEKIVMISREEANQIVFQDLKFNLTSKVEVFLNKILEIDPVSKRTYLNWLQFGATSNTPKSILEGIRKLKFLKENNVEEWDVSKINPNKRKIFAQIGRKSTNQALLRRDKEKRFTILILFLKQTLEDLTDEIIELFDRCLSEAYARSKNEFKRFLLENQKSTNEKLQILQKIGETVLDSDIPDKNLRKSIYSLISKRKLESAIFECSKIVRPKQDKFYDFFGKRHTYLREFIPELLKEIEFIGSSYNSELISAIQLLVDLNQKHKRKIPQDTSTKFIPKTWIPFVIEETDKINKKFFELCVLWELRAQIRSGDIWVKNSRKYSDPRCMLLPPEQWEKTKSEACVLLQLPEKGSILLSDREYRLEEISRTFDKGIDQNKFVGLENDKIKLSPSEAMDVNSSLENLKQLVSTGLPRVDLADLIIEVDSWTNFSKHLRHVNENRSKSKDLAPYFYASVIAQACNFGLRKMSVISGLSYQQLLWVTNWYLREETIQACINELVNYQYNLEISSLWGGGTLSSSDGQRFPVPVKSRSSAYQPKYFGYGRGLTYYTWTSDQYSQYGSKPIITTTRDSTYHLDAILDNETELQISEHTTDTSGYTELIFAIFDLLGLKFSPRIKDISDQRIYKTQNSETFSNIDGLFQGKINRELILNNWDEILRFISSIKMGTVTASLIISKLQEKSRKSEFVRALQEYGRLIKSSFILEYLHSEEYRRRVKIQLNKGEALHSLRQFLLFANEGKIWKAQLEDQTNQAACLTLLTNAVVVWNSRYMDHIVKNTENLQEEDIARISPCRFEHINKYGRYFFEVENPLNPGQLRPLGDLKIA